MIRGRQRQWRGKGKEDKGADEVRRREGKGQEKGKEAGKETDKQGKGQLGQEQGWGKGTHHSSCAESHEKPNFDAGDH